MNMIELHTAHTADCIRYQMRSMIVTSSNSSADGRDQPAGATQLGDGNSRHASPLC